MNDDIDASIKTVRDMASALRLEVDSRRRKVDEDVGTLRETLKILTEKVDTNASNIQRVLVKKSWLNLNLELQVVLWFPIVILAEIFKPKRLCGRHAPSGFPAS